MRPLAFLALHAIAACNSRQAAPKQAAVATTGSANDPWSVADASGFGGSGSAEPVPKWASDPPAVLRDKINGVNAHIVVLKSSSFPEYRDVLGVVERTAGVIAALPRPDRATRGAATAADRRPPAW